MTTGADPFKSDCHMENPVLFIGFNRPDLAGLVINRLRECGVRRLYIALDGPRPDHPLDEIKCRQMIEVVDSIDWVDEKVLLLRDKNLGCGLSVSEAITWFFSHVERGIILEDDCFPHPDFFKFCGSMLDRYNDSAEIWSIGGSSLVPDIVNPKQSHFFSQNFNMWGWATWRSSWHSYRYNMSQRSKQQWIELISQKSMNSVEKIYWVEIMKSLFEKKIDTWDFQAHFAAWNVNAFHVASTLNLVKNIGFRPDGTHTKKSSVFSERPLKNNPPPYEMLPSNISELYNTICFGKILEDSEWIFSNLYKFQSESYQFNNNSRNKKLIYSEYGWKMNITLRGILKKLGVL